MQRIESHIDAESFPEVSEALEEICGCHNFESESGASVCIYDRVDASESKNSDTCRLPWFTVKCEDASRRRFKVIINCRGYKWSVFNDFIWPANINELGEPEITVQEDYKDVARIVSHYMRLVGYDSSTDIFIEKYYTLTGDRLLSRGDMSEVKISEEVKVPETLRKAVNKLRDLCNISNTNGVRLVIYPENMSDKSECRCGWASCREGKFFFLSDEVIDKSELEYVRKYRNFNLLEISCLGYEYSETIHLSDCDPESAMLFLTDYLMFLNPGIKPDEIQAAIDFSGYYDEDLNYDDEVTEYDDRWWYHYHSDGTASPAEQFEWCLAQIEKWNRKFDE